MGFKCLVLQILYFGEKESYLVTKQSGLGLREQERQRDKTDLLYYGLVYYQIWSGNQSIVCLSVKWPVPDNLYGLVCRCCPNTSADPPSRQQWNGLGCSAEWLLLYVVLPSVLLSVPLKFSSLGLPGCLSLDFTKLFLFKVLILLKSIYCFEEPADFSCSREKRQLLWKTSFVLELSAAIVWRVALRHPEADWRREMR